MPSTHQPLTAKFPKFSSYLTLLAVPTILPVGTVGKLPYSFPICPAQPLQKVSEIQLC